MPTIKPYTALEQDTVAQELKTCGATCRVTKEFIKDYKRMRDETRAALTQLNK